MPRARVPQDRSRASSATRSCTRCWRRGGCSTRTTRPSPTCAPGCATIGERDTQMQLLRAATHALPPIYKAHKWFVTRGDLDYTALWILYAATPLAQIEVIGARPAGRPRGDPAGDEAEPGVLPDDLHRPAQRARRRGRPCRRRWTRSTATWPSAPPTLFAPVHRPPARGAARRGRAPRSRTTSSATSTSSGVTTACEYLADQGLHRQGVDARAAHEEEQHRGAGAGVLLPRERPTCR